MSTPELNALYEKIARHPSLSAVRREDFDRVYIASRTMRRETIEGAPFVLFLEPLLSPFTSVWNEEAGTVFFYGLFNLIDAARVLEALDACYTAQRIDSESKR